MFGEKLWYSDNIERPSNKDWQGERSILDLNTHVIIQSQYQKRIVIKNKKNLILIVSLSFPWYLLKLALLLYEMWPNKSK